jgi:5-keto 4-deoxyuronate isomerase
VFLLREIIGILFVMDRQRLIQAGQFTQVAAHGTTASSGLWAAGENQVFDDMDGVMMDMLK